jgi:hypothetical protein
MGKAATSANLNQVGGRHYKTSIEHWDFVVANDLNYFEGQITKYAARCRKKAGKQDLLKARHFIDKYLEVYDQVTGAGQCLSNEQTPKQDPRYIQPLPR